MAWSKAYRIAVVLLSTLAWTGCTLQVPAHADAPAQGVVWQLTNDQLDPHGDWDRLGVNELLVQWTAVDDVAFVAGAGLPAPRRPWLDDLATTIDLRDLPLTGDARIPLGLADIPQRQLQEAVFFEPDTDGHMLVYGTSGAGKSVALRSIGIAAGANPEAGRVAVYGIDFGTGALRSLETMPHVGSVVSGDDAERVQRLLRSLGRELDRRGKAFAAASAASLTEYRELVDPDATRIFLLLDNFPQFKADWEVTSARAPFYQVFMRILGEGRPLGIHAIATADRSGAAFVLPAGEGFADALRGALRHLLDDPDALRAMQVAAAAIADGEGTARVVKEMLE